MNRQELETHIRDIIKYMPLWERISKGDVDDMCRDFCIRIYNEFSKPDKHIEEMKFAIVETDGPYIDHAWLLVHHPEAGFLIVDPTAGQYIGKREDSGKPYRDVFIGTSDELEKLCHHKDSEYTNRWLKYAYWSPSAALYKPYCKEEDIPLWSSYEFPVNSEHVNSIQQMGRWAARMEEAGADWRHIMTRCTRFNDDETPWPNPADKDEVEIYDAMIEERNRHINLGNNKDGTPFSDLISSYNTGKTRC
jgi:hypothetical protein